MDANFDFENDFENLDSNTQAAPETPAEPAVEEVVNGELVAAEAVEATTVEETEEEEETTDDDFFTENAVPAQAEMDPAKVVTLRTSASPQPVFVEIGDGALPLVDIVGKSGIRFNGEYQGWLNGAQIDLGTKVAPGSTVNLIGSVKGGASQ